MTSSSTRCVLVLAIMCASAWPTLADDEPAAKLASKAKPLLRPVQSAHAKLASVAAKLGLMRIACRHYFEVLELDPDDGTARRALGFKKSGGEWTLDGPLPKVDKVKGEDYTKAAKEFAALEAKEFKALAKPFVTLAREATTLQLTQQATEYYQRALGYDPNDASAREALGHRLNKQKHWVVSNQANWLLTESIDKGEMDSTPTEFENQLNLKLTRRNSKRFYIAGPWSSEIMTEMCISANAAINSFHSLFGLKSFLPIVSGGKQIKQFFMPGEKDYTAFIAAFSEDDERRKKFISSLRFCTVRPHNIHLINKLEKDEAAFRNDRVVYLAGNKLAHALCGDAPPWIAEGVAWGLTLRILGTKLSFSVSLADTTTDYGAKNWSDHKNWRTYLREMVLIGDSPAPSAVFNTKDWNAISNDTAAYAWSMVDFLWQTMPEQFSSYCLLLGNGKQPEEASREAFGMGITELDAAWRAYVRRNY
jgi:tetratricopeptide (TPR) repeat protein